MVSLHGMEQLYHGWCTLNITNISWLVYIEYNKYTTVCVHWI